MACHGSKSSALYSETFTAMNKKHWDQVASTYSSAQWQKDVINRTHAFILSNLNWIGVNFLDPSTAFEKGEATKRQVRVLDYACGPGTMTSALQGYATDFIGVDVSDNMVKAYNEKFAQLERQTRTVTQVAKAFVGDLLDSRGPQDSISGPEFFHFDLAVVGYGFHHFEDLDTATSRLVSRLKPGGVLLIVDFVTHAKLEGDNPAKALIAHQGFGEQEVKSLFGRSSLVDVGVLEMDGTVEIKKPGDEAAIHRKVFLGRGRKPA